jgi:hypothetical protein
MAFVQSHASSSKSKHGGRPQSNGRKSKDKGGKVKSNQVKRQRADAELHELQAKVDGFVSSASPDRVAY